MLQEIDEYITQAKDRSYDTMMRFGKRGLNIAATAAVTAATKVKWQTQDKEQTQTCVECTWNEYIQLYTLWAISPKFPYSCLFLLLIVYIDTFI